MTVADTLMRIDAGWLSTVLGASVQTAEVEPVAFSGATTDMARVRVGYAAGASGPATLIAKIRGTSEVQRQMDGAIGLFEREAHFYGAFADQVPVRVPECHHVGDGDERPLLLEDLGGLRMGDQMDGVSVADAEALMHTLADLHAAFWESEHVQAPWLLRHDEGIYPQLVTQLVCSGAPALQERFADRAPAAVVAQVVAAAPAWGAILATAAQGPQTLVHNDCRLDNVFFDAAGAPCLIDWQVPSRTRGTQDVANLLAGSMDADDLADHWERLVVRYHDRLLERGVTGYSRDACLTHYRQNVFFPLGAGMALIGAMDIGDGRGLGDAIIVRCLRHIDAIDAFGAL